MAAKVAQDDALPGFVSCGVAGAAAGSADFSDLHDFVDFNDFDGIAGVVVLGACLDAAVEVSALVGN